MTVLAPTTWIPEPVSIAGAPSELEDITNGLLKRLNDHNRRNLLRSMYYDGKYAPRDLGMSIPPGVAQRLNAVLGWPAKAVDTLVQRVHWQGASTFEGAGDDLDAIIARNHLEVELPQVFTSALEHGVAFLMVNGQDDRVPIVSGRDATQATGVWDAAARELSAFLTVEERDEHHQPSLVYVYAQGRRYELAAERSTVRWALVGDYPSGVPGVPAVPLVFHPRLVRPFGSSRITRPVMSITDQAVRTVIRSEINAEFYAIPQRWLMGADESAFGLPQNGAGTWRLLVGRIMALADDDSQENPRAEVGQFPQASQKPHMDQLRSLAQLFSGETSIPVSSLGISIDSNPTSEGSYEASREDIIAEAESAITAWRSSVSRALSLALEVGGTGRDLEVVSQFRDPRYISRAAAADATLKAASLMPWLANTPEVIDMLGLDDGTAAALKAAQADSVASSPLLTLADAIGRQTAEV